MSQIASNQKVAPNECHRPCRSGQHAALSPPGEPLSSVSAVGLQPRDCTVPSVPGSSRMFSVVIRGNIEAEDEEITADTTEHLQDKVATFVSGMRLLTLIDFFIKHKIHGDYDGSGQQSGKCNFVHFYK